MRLTEEEIVKRLWESAEQYKPFIFMGFDEKFLLAKGLRADAIVKVSTENGPSFKALVEIAAVANPKTIFQKCGRLRDDLNRINEPDLVPVIVAPYIGKRQAKILSDEGISWIDLSGNMSIKIPNQLYIERTGKRNRFPDTAPIKKVFQGTSSLVSRALLLKPKGFLSLYEVVNFINSRNASITKATVSKVLKSLEEELLIDKTRTRISVIDTQKLLKRLAEGYTGYTKIRETKSYRFSPIGQRRGASARLNVDQTNYLVCGFYAAQIKGLATTDEITVFVKDIVQARREFRSDIIPDAEFGNLKFIETKDSAIWFNSTEVELTIASGLQVSMPVVDDIELYLEMVGATPRGPEIAEQLKWRIMKRADIDG